VQIIILPLFRKGASAPILPKVIHEDKALLVVSKPAGMHTAPAEGAQEELSAGQTTLYDWVTEQCPAVAAVNGRKPKEGGLLHRLDFETSGLVMFAKTQQSFDTMLKQFHLDKVTKGYLAVSSVKPSSSIDLQGKPNDLTPAIWQSVLNGSPAFKLPLRVSIDSYFQAVRQIAPAPSPSKLTFYSAV